MLKYGLDLTLEEIQNTPLSDLRERLLGEQEKFIGGDRLAAAVDAVTAQGGDDNEKLAQAFMARFRLPMAADELDPQRVRQSKKGTPERDRDGDGDVDKRDVLLRKARYVLRKELTDLEQFVLINIFDQAWKDHLYAMDMLKGGIGLQAFAEQDPRIAYKREGFRYFQQMMESVRDRVTDLIFRVRVSGQAPQARSSYGQTVAVHAEVDDQQAAYGAGGGQVEGVESAGMGAAADAHAAESAAAVASPGRDKAKGQAKKQEKKDRNKKGKR